MIKFKKLKIQNFLSFKDITFKFNAKGLYLIEGKNGSGKSSLFEALSWVIFGKTFKNIAESKLINKYEEKNCYVSLLFSINDKDYKIIKTKQHDEYKDTTMLFVKLEEWENISGKDQNDTHKEIEKLLGLNFKVFQNSIMLNSLNKSFAEMTDSEIKAIFDDLLDFKVYSDLQEINKQKMKDKEDRFTEINQKINTELSGYNILKTANDELEFELTSIKSINNDKIETLTFKNNNINSNIEKLKTEKDSFNFNIDEYNDNIEQLKNHKYALETAENKIHRIENDIVKDKTKIESYKEYIEKSEKDTIEIDIEKLEKDIIEITNKKDELRYLYNDAEDKNDNFKAEIAKINLQIDNNISMIQHFENLTDCPTCKQKVSDDYKKIIISNCNDKIKELKVKKAEIVLLDTEKLEQEIEAIKLILNNLDKDKRQVESNNKILKNIKQYKIDIADIEENIQQKSNDLTATIDNRDRNKNKIEKLETIIQNNSELYQKIKQFDNAIKSMNTEINNNNDMIKELKSNIEKQKERIKSGITKLNDKQQIIDDLKAEKQKINDELSYYLFIDEMFSNGGIKSYLLQNITPILNNIANSFSSDITNGHIDIQFETQSYIKSSKKWKEKFAIHINNKNGGEDYKANSSGEKTIIDLCILESLSYLVSLRAGKAFNIKIYDETFAALDNINNQKVIDYLQKQGEEKLIYVMSHDANFKNYFDDTNIISVNKVKNYTEIV